jgi:putative oxidoreductase
MKRLNFLNRYSSVLSALLRIVTALLFLSAGLVKLVDFPAGAQPGQMPIMSLLGAAAILEVVGGLILGLFARPVAFVLSGEMAVAYCMVHAPKLFPGAKSGRAGDPLLLHLFISGGGRTRCAEHRQPPRAGLDGFHAFRGVDVAPKLCQASTASEPTLRWTNS